MEAYQRNFIHFALQHGALKFGDFKLKSGRQSPYFFNMGVFHEGAALSKIGYFYATALQQSGLPFDVLFGPAYKGIPLACAATIALAQHYQQPAVFAFNRKEAKDYGEGGWLIGAPLTGQRVVIIDDVLTAGTAVRAAIPLIQQAGGTLTGILIALDRQERGEQTETAAVALQRQYHAPVFSIIRFEQLVEFLTGEPHMQETLEKLRDYRSSYGVV